MGKTSLTSIQEFVLHHGHTQTYKLKLFRNLQVWDSLYGGGGGSKAELWELLVSCRIGKAGQKKC